VSRLTVSQPLSTPTPGLTFSIVAANSFSVIEISVVALAISVSRSPI